MKTSKLRIVYEPVEKLKPSNYNPRTISEKDLRSLVKNMSEFGHLGILIANRKTNNLISGHQRLKVAKLLKMKEIAVVWIDVSLRKEKILNIGMNKISGEWDMPMLKDLLEEVNTGEEDMDMTGFDDVEIEMLMTEFHQDEIEEDEVPEPPEEPITKTGDLWLLGEHRVLCGDCTKEADVEVLMGQERADMVFTDPPYRMEAEKGSDQWVGKSAARLGEKIKDLTNFEPEGFLNILPSLLNGNMNAYIFCNKDLIPDYLNWCLNRKYSFNILFWKKPNALPLGGQHSPDVEYIVFFRKNAIWNNAEDGVTYSKCLEYVRDDSKSHPTIKPVGLIVNEIRISSNVHSIIVDPFLGSGTTLIAAEQLNRKCFGIEIEPRYVDVIIKRWENLTGKKAKLSNKGE